MQASSLNGMKKKFSYKNITNKNIRPLFLKSGKFVQIESEYCYVYGYNIDY